MMRESRAALRDPKRDHQARGQKSHWQPRWKCALPVTVHLTRPWRRTLWTQEAPQISKNQVILEWWSKFELKTIFSRWFYSKSSLSLQTIWAFSSPFLRYSLIELPHFLQYTPVDPSKNPNTSSTITPTLHFLQNIPGKVWLFNFFGDCWTEPHKKTHTHPVRDEAKFA